MHVLLLTSETRLRAVAARHMTDASFSARTLAAAMEISYSHLHRRLRTEANLTPTQRIRQVRLEEAARLLKAEAGCVSEVAYSVGFRSLSYFAKVFRAHYHVNPSAYPSG